MSNKDEDGLMVTCRKQAPVQVVRYKALASAQAASLPTEPQDLQV